MLYQCKAHGGEIREQLLENSCKDLLPGKRSRCKAGICFLLCFILVLWRLNKQVAALGLSRSLSIKTEMVVPTGGCSLDPLFRQSNVCSRTHANMKFCKTCQDLCVLWTLGLILQLPSDTVSFHSKEPKLYLHIHIYQVNQSFCFQLKLPQQDEKEQHFWLSLVEDPQEPYTQDQDKWAGFKLILLPFSASLQGLNVLVSWVWLGSECPMLPYWEEQKSQTYWSGLMASLALKPAQM